MSDYPDRRRLLGPALKSFFQTETGKKVGLAKIPDPLDGKLEMPYGILYPLPGSTSLTYSYNDPDECLVYIWQMTCVGVSHEQCAGMSDRFYKALLEKAPGSGYSHSLGLPGGMMDIYRALDSFGGIVTNPEDDNLYQTADTYRIEVQ